MVDLCHVDVGQGKPCFCYPPSTAETASGSASTPPNKGEYAFGANVQQDIADAMGSRLPRASLTMAWFGGPEDHAGTGFLISNPSPTPLGGPRKV